MIKIARLWPAATIAAALVAAIFATTASSHQPHGATHKVLIKDFVYDPEVLPVKVGDTVTWINLDIVPHTVTSEDGSWDSGEIAPGGTWTATITAGTVTGIVGSYFCGYHPVMRSKLEKAPL
jgi:plastocyanin